MNTPPPELQTAIHNASQTYGVPENILIAVWQKEAGGQFPNPYVNSSGYGGLFGTKDWNDTTQNQANEAAATLSYWYGVTGSWSGALTKYGGSQSYANSVLNLANPNGPNPSGRTGDPIPNSSGGGFPGIGDIGGAISSLTSTIGNIPATIAQDTQHLAIGAGFGILAILLIVSGIFIIIFTTETGRAAASSVPKAVPVPV